ncbi:hypothetical protein P170DRAFT_74090 [Aspergillus steynii IBT 23096]|uniref:Uncharacterized protein n=1 Tax=Aspergillus steynii IBT 23096 TaxID=1392250 RepID=A0A2I2FRD3_9EURO|nr:uncharacterized protein P170DRAFT_74090 [Aspergillus steynii IBT 23096]PLB43198.1 hypothetical protein P170DRAFT_74090 [Aspergillus steynii IBT 23096]
MRDLNHLSRPISEINFRSYPTMALHMATNGSSVLFGLISSRDQPRDNIFRGAIMISI